MMREGIFSDTNFGVILNGDIEGAKTIEIHPLIE